VGITVEPKVPALVYERFQWQFPYLERAQGVLDGVRRGLVGPPGPLGLAALMAGCQVHRLNLVPVMTNESYFPHAHYFEIAST
jgi:hypothetical protein